VLDVVTSLVGKAKNENGFVRLALYELHDPELVSLVLENKDLLELILSNSSKERNGDAWDATNHDARDELKRNGVRVHDRMFNNDHIGHNKFAVYFDTPAPTRESARAVMTGSTNWTSTGLCGQTNNALVMTRALYLVGWRTPVAAAGRFERCWIIPSQLSDGDCA